MYRFGEMGQNDHFGLKWPFWGQKGGEKSNLRFFGEKKIRHFFKTKKLVYMAKISNIQCTDLEK